MERELREFGTNIKEKAKRVAKAAALGAGLAGTVGAGAVEISHGIEEMHAHEQAYKDLETLAMTTPLERAQAHGLSLELPEMTPERAENIAAVDGGYTDLVNSENHSEMFERTCGYTTPDGTVQFDALKCNDFYGNQLVLDHDSLQNLADAYGYTPEEISVHGKIMQESFVDRGMIISVPNMVSTAEVNFHDNNRIPDSFKIREVYDGYYTEASAMTFSLIQNLDLTHASPKAQREAEKAIAELIKDNIVTENTTLLVSNDLRYPIEQNIKALKTGWTDDDGYFHEANMVTLIKNEEATKQAWSDVLKLERDPQGPVHELANAHVNAHEEIVRDIFKAGKAAGVEEDFLGEQLDKRLAALDVGGNGQF